MEISQAEIEKRIFRYTFTVNEKVKLHVNFNQAMMQKAADYMEALKVSRNLPNFDELDAKHTGVAELAKILFTKQETLQKGIDKLPSYIAQNTPRKSNEALLQESIDKWTTHLSMWVKAIETESVILALISEGELEVEGDPLARNFFKWSWVSGIRVYEVNEYIEVADIDPKYFDIKEKNKERLADGIPPLPQKNPAESQEQMLVLIDAVKRANPEFGIELNYFFENYANRVTINAYDIVREVIEYDDAGFHPESVDRNLDVAHGNSSPKVGRKPRATKESV